MKIAILGTRGVPAAYGGFETLAEELGSRLAARGHEVWVYGRPGFVDSDIKTYRGMHIATIPAIRSKHLETVSHTFLSAIHALQIGFDTALVCNAANVPFVRLLQIGGTPVALNVDGLERNRRKWGLAGRSYYLLCERLAALVPDAIVTDAEVIRQYYHQAYDAESTMITYGADIAPPSGTETLTGLGVEPGEYGLYVSRFEPENNPDRVASAWCRLDTERKLVMVGGARYAPDLERRIREISDHRIILPGPIYGEGYRQLLFNCRLYIHATEVGGTHPALVEAMGASRPVLVHDTSENREVADTAGVFFTFDGVEALENHLSQMLEDDDQLERLGRASATSVSTRYSWDAITDEYEDLLEGLC